MKAFKHLIKYAIRQGCTLSVFDGEDWAIKRSTAYRAIVEAVESVEEAQIRIYSQETKVGWALVSSFGLEDDETVIDHTITPFMDQWSEAYDLTQA